MAGAILINSFVYQMIKNKPSPLFDKKFFLPTSKVIDRKLIAGAILFGLGWGLAGICPGPGIVSLASGKIEVFLFVISMLVGMKIFKVIDKKLMNSKESR